MSLKPMFLTCQCFDEVYHLDLLACQDDELNKTIDMLNTLFFLGLLN